MQTISRILNDCVDAIVLVFCTRLAILVSEVVKLPWRQLKTGLCEVAKSYAVRDAECQSEWVKVIRHQPMLRAQLCCSYGSILDNFSKCQVHFIMIALLLSQSGNRFCLTAEYYFPTPTVEVSVLT